MRRPAPRKNYNPASDERKTWSEFYRRVRDPSIAREVLTLLNENQNLRREHSGLYLLCKESLRDAKLKRDRAKRIGAFIRSLVRAITVTLAQYLAMVFSRGVNIAVECLPEEQPQQERAVKRVKELIKEPEFKAAQLEFETANRRPKNRKATRQDNVVFPVESASSKKALHRRFRGSTQSNE